MSRPFESLGAVLRQNESYVTALESRDYPKLSVRLHGKGVVLDTPAHGRLVRMPRHQIARAGQVILSEIWGKKGAIGVVPSEGDGALCTTHFFLFDIDTSRLLPDYFQLLCEADLIGPQLAIEARGSTTYASVRPRHLLSAVIPLPPIDAQLRLLGVMSVIRATVAQLIDAQARSRRLTLQLWHSTTNALLPPSRSGTRLGDFVEVQSGYAFKTGTFSEQGVGLVRNANIGHGVIDWQSRVNLLPALRPQFARFELAEGDVLVSLDRPIISTGVKVARVTRADLPALLVQRVGRIKPLNGALIADYVFEWLRSPRFTTAIDPGRSNGVPHISPSDIERIPFDAPAIDRQHDVARRLRTLRAGFAQLEASQQRSETLTTNVIRALARTQFEGAPGSAPTLDTSGVWNQTELS